MKVPVLAFMFSVMVASSAATQIATDRSEAEVRGNPQTIRTEVARFSEKSGKLTEGPRILASEFSYDSRGNLTRSVVCDLKGSLYAKYSMAGAIRQRKSITIRKTRSWTGCFIPTMALTG